MLSINISELLLTVLSFFVLMFLLDKLLFKPVIRFREQRQSRMDESFRQESLAKEQQAQAQEEARQQRLASLKQAQDIAAQAKAQAGEEWLAAEKQMEQETQAAMTFTILVNRQRSRLISCASAISRIQGRKFSMKQIK